MATKHAILNCNIRLKSVYPFKINWRQTMISLRFFFLVRVLMLQFDFNDFFRLLFSFFSLGARNGLFPFPLNSEFINNYRRLYGPVQLTSIMNGNDLSKSPHRRSPVDSKRLKGKNHIIFWSQIFVLSSLLNSIFQCYNSEVRYFVSILTREREKNKYCVFV